jgi:hypothetical protein
MDNRLPELANEFNSCMDNAGVNYSLSFETQKKLKG